MTKTAGYSARDHQLQGEIVKKLALVAGLVLAASLAAAPLAFAQDEAAPAPTCADALVTLDEARAAHTAALAADKAAADAKKADEAEVEARAALDAAVATAAAAEARLDAALEANEDEQNNTPEQDQEIAAAQAAKSTTDAVVATRTVEHNATVAAAQADAKALQDEADKTDVTKTGPVLDEAVKGYNAACAGKDGADGKDAFVDLDCSDYGSQSEAQTARDADPSDPHNLDVDNDGTACEVDEPADDFDQVGEIPSGAIDTGRA